MAELQRVSPGMQILYAGNRLATVSDDVAERFQPGDRLLVVQTTGEVLHVPSDQWQTASKAVSLAVEAFQELNQVEDSAVSIFFERFATYLEDDEIWTRIAAVNQADVERAASAGRSTTRLVASDKMRGEMMDGLRGWARMPSPNGTFATIQHEGWRIDQVRSAYGVVAFVFEGRPNVLADGAGVLRSGNTAVMRIGGDALDTAKAIVELAVAPALAEAGLPQGCLQLIDSREHSAGWALFSDRRVGLAVARGSGRAVLTLGTLASQSGIPVSMHGTGGAWIVADETASAEALKAAVYHSSDRKVCNTVNVVCLPRSRAAELAEVVLQALDERGNALGHGFKLHVAHDTVDYVPAELFTTIRTVLRAQGPVEEPVAETISSDQLGIEWEWEQTPEVTLKAVDSTEQAVSLFNEQSPRFAASLISEDEAAHDRFFKTIDSPFVGNGFTRWVDGQYALNRPELGLSNWQYGRLLGRSGVLSGDSLYTVRLRATQERSDIHR
jgi:glutamate-5-semialdehyde dehydrogenase